MAKWWTTLGLVAASLGICTLSASAQYPPGGGTMPPLTGAFGIPTMGGPPPGAFGMGGGPPPGVPADFPNPAAPSQEPVSPFTIKDEGMPNAFTECETRPRSTAPYALTFRGEYIGWNLQKGPLSVPLVSTTSNLAPGSFGQLGSSNTSILVPAGTSAIDYGSWAPGFRLTAGVAIGYLPPIELSGFSIQRTANIFNGGSLSNPTQFLAFPFQNVAPNFLFPGTAGVGTETAAVISIPVGSIVPAQGGTINISSDLSFWGFEANAFLNLCETDVFHIDLIGGYRHLHLSENLNYLTQIGGAGGAILFNGQIQPATVFSSTTQDLFASNNSFDGGQVGFRGVLNMGRWALFSDIKCAMGNTNERIDISGSTTLNQNIAGRTSQTTPGGLLAQGTNSVIRSGNEFAFVPEANISLSFQLHDSVRFFGGYDVLYWSRVARPGDYVSNLIDARQVPTSGSFATGVSYNGPFAPALQQRGFLAQGFFIGMEIGF
ncbi:MAG TPA: BBP7 family outer membrane beta-barrel protein [Gemmataceae bacterium]|nr:BBP7 family outer membrane beta-barrel protein [Gemmataceae bacterium]